MVDCGKSQDDLATHKGTNLPIEKIKLVDFGFVTDPKDDSNRKTSRVGTPGWVAKEVVEDDDYIATAIDMWGVGTLLYVLISQRMPYTDEETCEKEVDMPDIRWKPAPVWEAVTPECRRIVARLLCKEPKDRMTARDLLTDPWLIDLAGPSEDILAPTLEEDDEAAADASNLL